MSPTKLNERLVGELERFLRDELTRLRASLQAIVKENRDAENSTLTDISTHAADTLHTEIQVALVGRRTQQVSLIEDALARLAEGQYGFCQECDEFIGVPRLRALPFAQRCRNCQDDAERRARREAGDAARGLPREISLEAA